MAVSNVSATATLSVYPNPVVSGTVNLNLPAQPRGNYTALLHNQSGQVVYAVSFEHNGGNFNKSIQLNKKITPGNYILELATPSHDKFTNNIIVR